MPYQDVKDRLYHGHRKIANNTHLQLEEYYLGDNAEVGEEGIWMRLHGNTVAIFHPEYVELFSAGWRTTTTKNRLNLALELAGLRSYIYQRNHQWYYHSHHYGAGVEFKDGIKIGYGGLVM